MHKAYRYLERTIKHDNWHLNPEENQPADLSCLICYPVDFHQIPIEFFEFWKVCILQRCKDSRYNQNTVEFFK